MLEPLLLICDYGLLQLFLRMLCSHILNMFRMLPSRFLYRLVPVLHAELYHGQEHSQFPEPQEPYHIRNSTYLQLILFLHRLLLLPEFLLLYGLLLLLHCLCKYLHIHRYRLYILLSHMLEPLLLIRDYGLLQLFLRMLCSHILNMFRMLPSRFQYRLAPVLHTELCHGQEHPQFPEP